MNLCECVPGTLGAVKYACKKKCQIKCKGVGHFISGVIVRVASVAMPTLTLVCLDVFWPIHIPHGT